MFGKAVKIRHCPATVSALEARPVELFRVEPKESGQKPLAPLYRELGRRFGKAQVRRPVLGATHPLLVPRGTEEHLCHFSAAARALVRVLSASR